MSDNRSPSDSHNKAKAAWNNIENVCVFAGFVLPLFLSVSSLSLWSCPCDFFFTHPTPHTPSPRSLTTILTPSVPFQHDIRGNGTVLPTRHIDARVAEWHAAKVAAEAQDEAKKQKEAQAEKQKQADAEQYRKDREMLEHCKLLESGRRNPLGKEVMDLISARMERVEGGYKREETGAEEGKGPRGEKGTGS